MDIKRDVLLSIIYLGCYFHKSIKYSFLGLTQIIPFLYNQRPFISRQMFRSVVTVQPNRTPKQKPRQNSKNIKTVEIFINDLDRQISKSFSKLKSQRLKLSECKKMSSIGDQTLPNDYSSMLQKTQAANIPSVQPMQTELSLSPKRKYQPERQDFVFLDNQNVIEYINLVYEMYQIKDPMDPDAINPNQSNFMTNKKIKVFKDNFQREIGSASTMKHSQFHPEIQLNPFTFADRSIMKTDHIPSTSKYEVISLHSKNKSTVTPHQIIPSLNIKNKNTLSVKSKITLATRKRSRTSCFTGFQVQKLFRYCFMCEEPILECNLEVHQKSCEPLKLAYGKDLSQIMSILNEKISNFSKQINEGLIQKSDHQITSEFSAIKSTVKNWLSRIPVHQPKCINEKDRRGVNENWRQEFYKLEQNINNCVYKSFESLNKLFWFSRLRENIALKLYQ